MAGAAERFGGWTSCYGNEVRVDAWLRVLLAWVASNALLRELPVCGVCQPAMKFKADFTDHGLRILEKGQLSFVGL